MGILGGLIGWTLFYFFGILSIFFVIIPALAQINWEMVAWVVVALVGVGFLIALLPNPTPVDENASPAGTTRIPVPRKMYLGTDETPTAFRMRVSKTKHQCSGDIIENQTLGLQWMRCTIGQTRHHGICTGGPLICTFEAAQKIAKDEFPGWRIPSIEELRTLVHLTNEKVKLNPRYFPTDFPTGIPSVYYSSTAAPGKKNMVLGIIFRNGMEVQLPRRRKVAFARLVRGIPRSGGSLNRAQPQ